LNMINEARARSLHYNLMITHDGSVPWPSSIGKDRALGSPEAETISGLISMSHAWWSLFWTVNIQRNKINISSDTREGWGATSPFWAGVPIFPDMPRSYSKYHRVKFWCFSYLVQ
jgi:hypothetical protein